VLHFHSNLVPNEIHLRTLHTRTCTGTTWSNKGVFNSKDRNPPFLRHFPYGSNRPYQATQLLNHGWSLCRPLSPHCSTYCGKYPQMLSPFWLLPCFILRTSVILKRPIMVCNCCNCCCCCDIIITTVITFRRSSTLTRNTLKITYQGYDITRVTSNYILLINWAFGETVVNADYKREI
jgi:hypothetical protein